MKTTTRMLIGLIAAIATSSLLAAAVHKVRTTPLKGTVALTFDDGPSPIYTPQVLAILKRYGIHATFFVVAGNAKRHPEMIKAILADGNNIANHSMTHPKLTRLSGKRLQWEIGGAKKVITKLVGKPPACLRPPFGLTNARVKAVIEKNGMIQVPIGYNSFDYARPGVKKLIHNVVSHAHPGMVVLLHDGYRNKQQTVDALPGIIEGIKKKGLGFSMICLN
ncbi:MAG: polysaccharide deacetylase family protein [Coxiellaceae bacterium]|nr:polysaccharide deacetylase family protein [Coxiellaceae bacterium]